ncbi:19897_t:CDS:2, partial [Gigaspora margarita]
FFNQAAFITVVGYNINDNESTPIPIRFGKELFNETGEKLMSILIAISAFGCAKSNSETDRNEESIDETDRNEGYGMRDLTANELNPNFLKSNS